LQDLPVPHEFEQIFRRLRLTALRRARGAGVAVAESHAFAVRERIEPDELADQGWVVGPPSADAPEFGAWPGIIEPRITFTARDWPTRLGLVAAGLGIALVPGIAAPAVPRGVRWIPVHDDAGGLRRAVWAATSDHPSAAATAMVRALKEEVSCVNAQVRWKVPPPRRTHSRCPRFRGDHLDVAAAASTTVRSVIQIHEAERAVVSPARNRRAGSQAARQ
jgi:hypothetical protein